MNNITVELSDSPERTKLEKFLKNQGRQDFIDDVVNMSREQLDDKMLRLAKHREEIQSTKNKDQELIQVKEKKKMLEAPYREQKKMNDKLARYVMLVMQDRGYE